MIEYYIYSPNHMKSHLYHRPQPFPTPSDGGRHTSESRAYCQVSLPCMCPRRHQSRSKLPVTIWKSSLIISIPNPGKDTSIGTSYRPISLLCPATKVLESLILPTIYKYLQPAPDQHSFRPDHSTISALLQITTNITIKFNQRKSPDRTICLAVDL